MTGFILRILFSGLIAFVPSEDGTELTVLLLNVDHGYHTSDGTSLSHHKPIIIARGGSCSGDCPTDDAEVAQFIFADKTLAVAKSSLQTAVNGGAAWALSGSDLSIVKGSSSDPDLPALALRENVRGAVNGVPLAIPTTAVERGDFSWVADLKQICPTGCTLNPAVLGTNPPAGLVAARLRLKSGNVFTYSVARIGANVTPVRFQRLDGTGSTSPYSQAVASWVGADIQVGGDSIEIVESKFDGGAGRTMTLSPGTDGKVEMAVLNLPPFVPPSSASNDDPQVGKHFEAYYELSQTPQARETRLVPKAGAASGVTYPQVDWATIHPSSELWSDLLNLLRLNHGRSIYDRILCPPVKDPLP